MEVGVKKKALSIGCWDQTDLPIPHSYSWSCHPTHWTWPTLPWAVTVLPVLKMKVNLVSVQIYGALINLDSIFKSRDITLPTKVHLVKATVFPVVMYGCESWTVKKAECRRTDVFELWCWRRLLRVPWTARRSNHSILKEISPGISLEGMMLTLKLQYFGHLMQRVDSLEKTLMLEGLGAGGEGDDRGWDGWMASPTWWTWIWVNSGSWWWAGRLGVLWFMGSQRVRHHWVIELNWLCVNYRLTQWKNGQETWRSTFWKKVSNDY